jgi:hypothetical protein
MASGSSNAFAQVRQKSIDFFSMLLGITICFLVKVLVEQA